MRIKVNSFNVTNSFIMLTPIDEPSNIRALHAYFEIVFQGHPKIKPNTVGNLLYEIQETRQA